MFSSRVWKVEAGGCCPLFSSRLCWIPYPKYMAKPRGEMRQWEGKVGSLLTYKCPMGFLLWHLTQCGARDSRKRTGFSHSTVLFRAFPGGSMVKNMPTNTEASSPIPGLGTKIPPALEQLSLHWDHMPKLSSYLWLRSPHALEFVCQN